MSYKNEIQIFHRSITKGCCRKMKVNNGKDIGCVKELSKFENQWTMPLKEAWHNFWNFLPGFLARPKISNISIIDNCRSFGLK